MLDRRLAPLALGLFLNAFLGAPNAHAQDADAESRVPPALEPWVPWVLSNESTYGCTSPTAATEGDRMGEPICVWPGELRIEVAAGGATW